VDPAESIDDGLDDLLGIGFDGHVTRDGEPFRPGGTNPFDGGFAGFDRSARHADLGSRARHGLGERRSDRASAARHESDAAVQAEDVELTHGPPRRVGDDAPRGAPPFCAF